MNKYFENIDEYKKGQLSEVDLKAFELELSKNGELKTAVEYYELAKEISMGFLEKEVREVLNDELPKYDSPSEDVTHKDTSVSKSNRVWWALGIIGLLCIGGYFLYNMSPEPIQEPIYVPSDPMEFASLYTDPAWPIERGSNTNNQLSQAIKIALNGNNASAVEFIKTSKLQDSEKNYWISELYTKVMMSDNAMKYLNKSLHFTSNQRRDRINYLKIINLYNLKKYQQVKQLIFELPADTDGWYKDVYTKIK